MAQCNKVLRKAYTLGKLIESGQSQPNPPPPTVVVKKKWHHSSEHQIYSTWLRRRRRMGDPSLNLFFSVDKWVSMQFWKKLQFPRLMFQLYMVSHSLYMGLYLAKHHGAECHCHQTHWGDWGWHSESSSWHSGQRLTWILDHYRKLACSRILLESSPPPHHQFSLKYCEQILMRKSFTNKFWKTPSSWSFWCTRASLISKQFLWVPKLQSPSSKTQDHGTYDPKTHVWWRWRKWNLPSAFFVRGLRG